MCVCCEMIAIVSSVSIHHHKELQKNFFFLWLYSFSFEQFGRMCKCLNQKGSGILKPHSLHIMMFGDCLSSDCQFYYKKKGLQVGCMRQVPGALGRPRGIR